MQDPGPDPRGWPAPVGSAMILGVWLFLGAGEQSRPVIGGQQLTRACEQCKQTTVFYEQEVSRTVELYFVKMFAFAPKNVMKCGACGATFATGASTHATFNEQQAGTIAGTLGAAAERAKTAFEDGTVEQQFDRAQDAVKNATSAATSAVTAWWKRRG